MDRPFTDKIKSADVAKRPAEYQVLLKRVLAIQADCEIGGPHLYVRSILPDAPTKVDRLIVARTAAQEADHYRKAARLTRRVALLPTLRCLHLGLAHQIREVQIGKSGSSRLSTATSYCYMYGPF